MTHSEYDANLALQSAPTRKAAPVRRQRGFTLIEVFICAVIVLAFAGCAALFVLLVRLFWNLGI